MFRRSRSLGAVACAFVAWVAVAALLITAACDPTKLDGQPPRLHWLARDLRSGRPVLLHTDARSRDHYTVAKSWSPLVADHSEVARAGFTLCWLGDTAKLPMSGSLEGMSMDVEADGVVTLALSFDLTWPSAPSRYRCTAEGPVWLSGQ